MSRIGRTSEDFGRALRRLTTGTLAAGTLVLAGGCDGEDPTAPVEAPEAQDPLALLPPGIHPILVVESQSGGVTRLQVRLRRVGEVPRVGSVQLVLSYDAQAVKLRGGSAAASLMAAWNETEPGRVKVAAAALGGIEEEVVTLELETTQRLGAESFRLELEEITGGDGFEPVQSYVAPRETPLFSAQPIS